MNLKCQIYIESIMMILLSIEKINGGSHKVQLSAPQNETFLVYFNPPVINNLKVNSRQSVYFNCSPLEPGSSSQENSTSYAFVIISDNDNIARPVVDSLYDKSVDMEQEERYAVMSVEADREHNFTIEAMHVGRVTMSVAMLNTYHNSMDVPEAHYVQAISVSVKREQRLADIVFNSSAAAVAILISFGIGCVTDTESLKRQLKYPVSLVIGFCCQFILMPVVSITSVLSASPCTDTHSIKMPTSCLAQQSTHKLCKTRKHYERHQILLQNLQLPVISMVSDLLIF